MVGRPRPSKRAGGRLRDLGLAPVATDSGRPTGWTTNGLQPRPATGDPADYAIVRSITMRPLFSDCQNCQNSEAPHEDPSKRPAVWPGSSSIDGVRRVLTLGYLMNAMSTAQLTYASPGDPAWKRFLIRAIERATGQRQLEILYGEMLKDTSPMAEKWAQVLEQLGIDVQLDRSRLVQVPTPRP